VHVDAASGGFIAPFLYPELVWDFRLPNVKSINVSGHKCAARCARVCLCVCGGACRGRRAVASQSPAHPHARALVCRYGLVYAGIGWVLWREPSDVPDDVSARGTARTARGAALTLPPPATLRVAPPLCQRRPCTRPRTQIVFHTNYLGSDQPSITLNFSRGASHIM
jgi:glutamate decarboxylase